MLTLNKFFLDFWQSTRFEMQSKVYKTQTDIWQCLSHKPLKMALFFLSL